MQGYVSSQVSNSVDSPVISCIPQVIPFTELHHLRSLLRHILTLSTHCFRCKELFHPHQHITTNLSHILKDSSLVLPRPQFLLMCHTNRCTPTHPLRSLLQDLIHISPHQIPQLCSHNIQRVFLPMHLRMQVILQTKPSLSLKISAEEIHLPQVCIPRTAEHFLP